MPCLVLVSMLWSSCAVPSWTYMSDLVPPHWGQPGGWLTLNTGGMQTGWCPVAWLGFLALVLAGPFCAGARGVLPAPGPLALLRPPPHWSQRVQLSPASNPFLAAAPTWALVTRPSLRHTDR